MNTVARRIERRENFGWRRSPTVLVVGPSCMEVLAMTNPEEHAGFERNERPEDHAGLPPVPSPKPPLPETKPAHTGTHQPATAPKFKALGIQELRQRWQDQSCTREWLSQCRQASLDSEVAVGLSVLEQTFADFVTRDSEVRSLRGGSDGR